MDNQQQVLRRSQAGAPSAAFPDGQRGRGSTLFLGDLLHTSRELSEALTPRPLRESFRAELREELVLTARRLNAQRALTGDWDDEPADALDSLWSRGGFGLIGGYIPSRRAVLGAAAVGLSSAVSVIGVMAAYYWRRRGRKPEDELDAELEDVREAA